MINIYSHCYQAMIDTNCNNCTFNAIFDNNEKRVELKVSICNDNDILVTAFEGTRTVWGPTELNVNCNPENCPFSDPSEPICK